MRVILRDSHRQMYDHTGHKRITMRGLHELVRMGIEFKVMEGNLNITRETLLKLLIIKDDILTIDILREIILSDCGNFKVRLNLMIAKTIKDFSESRYKYLLR